jgi:hypothetical protein
MPFQLPVIELKVIPATPEVEFGDSPRTRPLSLEHAFEGVATLVLSLRAKHWEQLGTWLAASSDPPVLSTPVEQLPPLGNCKLRSARFVDKSSATLNASEVPFASTTSSA